MRQQFWKARSKTTVRMFQCSPQPWNIQRCFPRHIQVLATLPGEQKRHSARKRLLDESKIRRQCGVAAALNRCEKASQALEQLSDIGSDNAGCDASGATFGASQHGVRNIS